MSKHTNFLRAAAVAVLFATPAMAADEPNGSTVLATVNGEQITLAELIAVRATLPAQYADVPSELLFNSILQQLVQQTALAQSLNGIVPPRAAIALKNEKRALLASEAIEAVLGDGISEEELQAAYNEQFAAFEGTQEYNASHILVETEEEAEAIIEELETGGNFAMLAQTKSTGPSGPSGGELGWFGLGQMVKPFEDAVIGMTKNEISAPVETQFGWHVIQLNDMRASEAPSFEEMRAQLEVETQRQKIDSYVMELTAAADIDQTGIEGIDPALLERTDLLETTEIQD